MDQPRRPKASSRRGQVSNWTGVDTLFESIHGRFIMTRFYFLISVQGMNHPDARRQHIIVDCSEVVKDEIWAVTIYSQGVREEYYVLEPTCEVIGCQDNSIQAHRLQPRVDWTSYISQRNSGEAGISLFERLRWPNREEYETCVVANRYSS